jgi:integration host factor subunit beta
MTKSKLVDALSARTKLTKLQAELVVNTIFDVMTEALQQGEGIELRGFGSFTVRAHGAYSGRNPRTGEVLPIAAKRLPFFKVGKELRVMVNEGRHLPITGDDDDEQSR